MLLSLEVMLKLQQNSRTQLDPVKLNQSMGMAIKSFYHGSINNITSKNNKMSFSVNVNGLQGVNADWRTENSRVWRKEIILQTSL